MLMMLLCHSVTVTAQQRISLTKNDTPIKEIIEILRSEWGYSFAYKTSEVNLDRNVSISVSDSKIDDVLEEIFKDQPVIFSVEGKLIYLVAKPMVRTQGKDIPLTGKVLDDKGNPVPGAYVLEKGTKNGTVTDSDGVFCFDKTPESGVLVVSSLGFEDKEVSVSGKKNITVSLQENRIMLDETVVVGYASQKKATLTGSVSSIKIDDNALGRPVTSVSSSLAGLAAGVAVNQTTGKPGTSATIRIRGIGTLNNNSPLVLVDGVEWSMDNLNPADIESISVLKDAASTAIYGAQGANGVILVTTRQGDGKIRFDYNGYVSIQQALNKLSMISDYADYMELVNESLTNVDNTPYYTQATIDMWRRAGKYPTAVNEYGVPNYIAYPNTEWFSEIFKTGVSQNHHLSMAGSSNGIRYSAGVGYTDNPGIMNVADDVNSGAKKLTVQAKGEGTVGKWLTLGTNIYGTMDNLGAANTANVFTYLGRTCPGIWPGEPYKYGVPASSEESTTANNLLSWLDRQGQDKRESYSLTGYFKARLIEGLQLEGKVNYLSYRRDYKYFGSARTSTWDYARNEVRSSANLTDQQVTNANYHSGQTNTELLLRYNVNIADTHEITALAGYSTQHYLYDEFSARKKGMTSESLTDLNALGTMDSITGYSTEWAMASLFGRLNYSYKSRYIIEGNVRYDGSSRFSPKSRWGLFPSVSGAWRLSEEPFMSSLRSWLDNFKIRASYGVTGNNRTSNYAWQATYASSTIALEGGKTSAMFTSKIGNENLKWETTRTTDVGIDFAMFGNRLSGEVDWYNKNTSGILFVPSLSITMGQVTGATENIAEVNNKGLEFNLKWNDKVGDFRYAVGANISFNRNIVKKYKGALVKGWAEDGQYVNNLADVSESGFGGRIAEGYKLGETYLRKIYRGTGDYDGSGNLDLNAGPKDGIIRTESDMEWVRMMVESGYKFCGVNMVSKNTLWYGDIIYEDSNGDGNYGDTNDQNFTGHTSTPKYTYGLNVSLGWKGIDLYMLFSGAGGHYLYWQTAPSLASGYNTYSFLVENRYFYDPENPGDPRTAVDSKYPRMGGRNTGAASDFWEYKGDYLKLKNIQLGYTLPSSLTRRFKVDRLRVYATADNLFTVTSYPGLDPEIGTSITYPLMRQYALGIQLTF